MRPKITDMSCEHVHVIPVSYDWAPARYDADETGNGWTYIEATRCEKCGEACVGSYGDPCDCTGYVPATEGPMMSDYYPLPGLDESDAIKLADTCLCVVTVDGATGLALTGGGMDLSWEICEAYMLLGYLPPLHFCDLPGMSGRGLNARDRWIVSGCLRTCELAASWATRSGERLRATVRQARKDAARS